MNVTIHVGDALQKLRELPDRSVHCCVTSPPYWGLRAYHGDDGMIGLESTFDQHVENLLAVFEELHRVLRDDGTLWLNYGDAYAGSGKGQGGANTMQNTNPGSFYKVGEHNPGYKFRGFKPKDLMMMPSRVAIAMQEAGWFLRSEIVWAKPNPMPESTRDRPTSAHEKVFLFAKSGHNNFWTHRGGLPGVRTKPEPDYFWRNRYTGEETTVEPEGWKELVDDDDRRIWSRINNWIGWNYYYDQEAVRSPVQESTIARLSQKSFDTQTGGDKDPGDGNRSHRKVLENLKRRTPSSWATSEHYQEQDPRYKKRGHERAHQGFDETWDGMTKAEQQWNGANMRNIWTFAPAGYKEAHFATFPFDLVEPCIAAGTSMKGSCLECGAPWVRTVSLEYRQRDDMTYVRKYGDNEGELDESSGWRGFPDVRKTVNTTGWQPSCECDAKTVPCTVIDPFGGAGTTGLVAVAMSRDAVLIEISEDYAKLAADRIKGEFSLLCKVDLK